MKTRAKSSKLKRTDKKSDVRQSQKTKHAILNDEFPKSYRLLTEHFKIGVYRTTPGPQGKFLEVNPALMKMLGFEDRDELLKLPVSHFYQNPIDRVKFSEKLSREGLIYEEELTFRRKDGSPLVVSEIAVAGRDNRGNILYFDGLVEDISERRQSEIQYDLQKTYLEKLFNAAPEAIALHDNTDCVMDINDEFTSVFGYTRDEAIGRHINDLVAPKELSQEAEDISRRVIRGERIELETKRKRKDGTLIDVSILGAPIFHQGTQIGDYAIYRDITERKKTEEEIRIQKTYLESLLNSAPEAIVFHNLDDIVVNVNDEFLRMFGFLREEAIGKPINSLVVPTELKAEAEGLSHSVVHGERVEMDTQRRRRDGTLFHVSILGAPIFHQGTQIGVYAIYRDISERKREEEARIRVQEEARMARNIQMNFLPKSNPDIRGYDIAGTTIPAMNVGGDYYDFIQLDDYQLAIGVGDVSGNGLAASLVMANLQATIRSQALSGSDPAHCLERANKLLYRSTDARTFVSLFYGILDTRNHSLSYANAGQNLPILFSKGTPPRCLSTRGIALGLKEDASYNIQIVSICPDDIILFYTDGITEAMNGRMEEFGEENVRDIILLNKSHTAPLIIEALFKATHDFVVNGSPHDDMTAVVLKRIR